MILPPHRRLLPAALALLAAAELSAGAVGLATQAGGSHRPGPDAGTSLAGPGSGGVSPGAASGSRGSGPIHSRGGGGVRAGTASTPAGVAGPSAPSAARPVSPLGGSTPSGPPGSGPIPAGTSGSVAGPGSSPSVTCETDLSLDRSPDTGYNFLCRSGGVPLTWATSTLTVYEQGLSPVQSTAVDVALAEWEPAARFGVTYTSDEAVADVVITSSPLGSGQPGYVEDGYTTVSYRCSPRCAYYHANLDLSSTASLTSTDWISTVLHELGHVAGLNHVSQTGEVMYPYLTPTSPVVYAPGDRQGLDILAAERGA